MKKRSTTCTARIGIETSRKKFSPLTSIALLYLMPPEMPSDHALPSFKIFWYSHHVTTSCLSLLSQYFTAISEAPVHGE